MKKFILLFAAAMLTASVSAQKTAVTANKAGDNWYVGINAGAATPMQKWGDTGFFKGFAPKVGVRVGKNLTTVFGLAADADMYFGSKTDSKSRLGSKTFVNAINVDILGTANLMNAFAGYKGEPRFFEIIALGGFGWSHAFGYSKMNAVNTKVALDFALNLGADKAWQVYIEPAAVFGNWSRNGKNSGLGNQFGGHDVKYDSRAGILQLSAGVNYKFGTSNGTHNFAVEQLRDQAEIDALNAQINDARRVCDEKCAARDAEIARLKKALQDCENKPAQVIEKKPATITNLQPTVLFRQGKSTIDAAQYAPIELIAHYMKNHPEAKVEIKGYASPEGKAEFNQKLSEKRAEVVKNVLVKKYKIAADRLTTVGCGATDKLFEQVEFNRVATFNDSTKD